MQSEISERLDATFDEHRIIEQIHDVPPHVVYEVEVDGKRAIYKADVGPTGSAAVEGRVMDWLAQQTDIPVPEVLAWGDDHFVAAWQPQAPGHDAAPADVHWAEAAGAGLARLHEASTDLVDGYGVLEVRDGELSGDIHADWYNGALAYIDRLQPVLERYGHGDIATAAIELFEERPTAFEGAGQAVLCHGWATPEHVAVENDTVACLIDFEHAIAAPGEFDIWRTCIPAFGPGETTPEERAFISSYEAISPLPHGADERKSYYKLLNLLYFFESLYVQEQHDPETTEERARKFRSIVEQYLETL